MLRRSRQHGQQCEGESTHLQTSTRLANKGYSSRHSLFRKSIQGHSTTPLVRRRKGHTIFRATLHGKIPTCDVLHFTHRAAMVVGAMVTNDINRRRVLIRSNVAGRTGRIIRRLASSTRTPHFQKGRGRHCLDLVTFTNVSFRRFVSLRGHGLVNGSSATVLAYRRKRHRTVSHGDVACPLHYNGAKSRQTRCRTGRPAVAFDSHDLNNTKGGVVRISNHRSVRVARIGHLTRLVLARPTLVIQGVPVVVQLVVRVPDLASGLFGHKGVHTARQSRRGRF